MKTKTILSMVAMAALSTSAFAFDASPIIKSYGISSATVSAKTMSLAGGTVAGSSLDGSGTGKSTGSAETIEIGIKTVPLFADAKSGFTVNGGFDIDSNANMLIGVNTHLPIYEITTGTNLVLTNGVSYLNTDLTTGKDSNGTIVCGLDGCGKSGTSTSKDALIANIGIELGNDKFTTSFTAGLGSNVLTFEGKLDYSITKKVYVDTSIKTLKFDNVDAQTQMKIGVGYNF